MGPKFIEIQHGIAKIYMLIEPRVAKGKRVRIGEAVKLHIQGTQCVILGITYFSPDRAIEFLEFCGVDSEPLKAALVEQGWIQE